MSIRLHRTMGWGMDFAKFKTYIGIEADIAACNHLEKVFDALTEKDLTYKPDRVMEQLKYNEDDARPLPVIIRNLLALEYADKYDDINKAPVGSAFDLYTVTDADGGAQDHIIFYPNLYYRKKWYRVNDDLDYAFEQAIKVGGNQDPDLNDFVRELKFNHYPWTNSLMDKNGTPMKWQPHYDLAAHGDWAPAVPTEIRWYLTEHNILSHEGVNELRPIVAQYWC